MSGGVVKDTEITTNQKILKKSVFYEDHWHDCRFGCYFISQPSRMKDAMKASVKKQTKILSYLRDIFGFGKHVQQHHQIQVLPMTYTRPSVRLDDRCNIDRCQCNPVCLLNVLRAV